MIYRDIVQRSPEWFEMRLGKVTGSRVGDIMKGVRGDYLATRTNYMMELATEILTGEREDFYINEAMQHGIDSEPLAIGAYEANNGVFIEEVGLCTHPTIERFQASPDGITEDGCIEIKCLKSSNHLKVRSTGKVNRKYEWQMYAEMMCSERKKCTYVGYDFRLESPLDYYEKEYTLTKDIEKAITFEVEKFLGELDVLVAKLKGIQNENV